MIIDAIKNELKRYFNLKPYLEDEESAKKSIIEGISFRGPNIMILILAIFVACLGLNTNSAAVIIGAMLISPLMGPIVGIGLGTGTYDFQLIKRSARNLAAATIFSVIASTIYFLISPVSEGHSELLARTSPTIYDVLIAFFGGGAGVVAIACKDKGNVIPGVAIATALMPPLCTAGYGIATLQLHYFTGAFYLFVINSIFIALSTLIGVKLFKFHEVNFVNPERRRKIKTWVTTIVIATMLPSIFLTVQMFRESFFVNSANAFVEEEIAYDHTKVFSKSAYIKNWKKYINVTLIGAPINTDSLTVALTQKMDKVSALRGAELTISQFGSQERIVDNSKETFGDMFGTFMSQIDRQKATIDSLRFAIQVQDNLDSISYSIAPEVKVVYPEIKYISVSRMMMCNTTTHALDTVNVAMVELRSPLRNRNQLQQYIEVRTGLSDVRIIETNLKLPSDTLK